MRTIRQSIIETRRHQMFPVLEFHEIERVRRFGESRSYKVGEALQRSRYPRSCGPRAVLCQSHPNVLCGGQMIHDPANVAASASDTKLRGLLGGMSVFTMIMTVPQVWAIWVGQQAAGGSILSWSAYLVSALLWLWFGIQKRDRNIYLPCLGWITLDAAVIVGAVVYG